MNFTKIGLPCGQLYGFSHFSKSEIKDYCKKNLAKYMVPHEFVYRKKLPKTKLGKVDFKKLESDSGKDD